MPPLVLLCIPYNNKPSYPCCRRLVESKAATHLLERRAVRVSLRRSAAQDRQRVVHAYPGFQTLGLLVSKVAGLRRPQDWPNCHRRHGVCSAPPDTCFLLASPDGRQFGLTCVLASTALGHTARARADVAQQHFSRMTAIGGPASASSLTLRHTSHAGRRLGRR